MRVRGLSFVVAALCFLAPMIAFAQTVNVTSGSINGRVTDSNGGVLPGVSVTATSLDTGLKRTVTSEKDGAYTINLLPPGRYRVDAELSGLGKASATNIDVLLGNSTRADLKISPQSAETVTVTAPTVDTSRTGTAVSVTNNQIENLPLLGRDFKALASLTPGIVDAFGGRITGDGARGLATDYNIDGATSNNDFFGENTGGTRAPFTFSQAAIREFQVVRSQYDAEYGRGVGAQLNAITKSGTNMFSGEGFIFHRDRGWATRRPLFFGDCAFDTIGSPVFNDATHPTCRQVTDSFRAKNSNQGGFAIGGPIQKDKLFFFANFDSQRQSLPVIGTDVRTTTQWAALTPTLQQGFLDKFQQIIGYPYSDSVNYNTTFNQNTYMGKVDANLGTKTRLSVRDNYTNFTNANNQSSGNLSQQGTENDKFNQLVGQATTILTSNLVNEALVEVSVDQRPIAANVTGTEFRVTGLSSSNQFFGQRDSLPNNTRERKVQVKDTVRRTMGSHTFKAGTELLFMHIDNLFASNAAGQFQYSSVANFENGVVNTFLQGFGPGEGLTSWNQNTYAIYGSDNFRVNPRLTVDAGVRYDWQTMPKPATNAFPQHPEFITNIHEDKNNVAPRLGVAYDVTGDGKSVLRGGVGKFFGYMPDILLSNPLTQISGNFLQGSITCATATVVQCPTFPTLLTGAQFNQLAITAGTNVVTISPTYQAQEAWRSSLQFERELGHGYSAAVGGVYSRMSKVQGSRNINAVNTGVVLGGVPVYSVDPAAANRLYTDMGVVRELCSCETASYRALTFETHKRTQTKFTPAWDLSYTWSKSIDEDTNERSTSTSFLFDPNAPALSRGPSDNDVPHRFVGNAMYRLPWGGVDIGAIFQVRSGVPYNPGIFFSQVGVPGSPTSLNGLSQTSGDIPIYVDSTGKVIDLTQASGFTQPQLAAFLAGQGAHIIGRNAYRQPSWHTMDLRISKTFEIPNVPHHLKVQLIAEAFNLLNTQNKFIGSTKIDQFNATLTNSTGLYTFVSNVSPTGFGVVSSYASTPDPRQLQVAVKFIF